MLARISGAVFAVARRNGTARQSGDKYSYADVKILVQAGDQHADLVNVSVDLLADSAPMSIPAVGDVVDVLVRLSAYNGEVRARYLDVYPSHELASV